MSRLFSKVTFYLISPVRLGMTFVKHRYGRMRLERLMARGMKVGKNVYIENGVVFDQNYPYLIEIEDNCRIAHGTTILAHDATIFPELGVNRLAPVKILKGSFVGERAIILPGVTIGPNAVIAAGAMVNRDIGEGKIAAGNPARPYANFSDLIEKYKKIVSSENTFFRKDIEIGKLKHSDIENYLNENSVAFIHGVPQQDICYLNENMDEIRCKIDRQFNNLNRDW